MNFTSTVLEITVGHWPFSDQFQYLADQNTFQSANFTAHFQWDGNNLQNVLFSKNGLFLTLISITAITYIP